MGIREENTIRQKIEELENSIKPEIRYNIYNNEMPYINHNNYYTIGITRAKINTLKWILKKKRKL